MYALVTGGVDTGWTFYTPYSTSFSNTQRGRGRASGIFITGFSSILTGLNFIVTIHKMRAPGHDLVPPAAVRVGALRHQPHQVLGTPVIAVTILMVAVERGAATSGIFDPALGGDPVLFQHLFWFYSHPAVYIMILPAMGVISELVTCFSRKRIFGYAFIAMSSLAIAVIGFLVWGHHMFVSGQSAYAGDGLLRALASWWPSPPRSRSSTGRPPSTRARSPGRPRCSTPSASSASSPSAASPASSWPRSASTSTCTTPTSSSPTSTTSWWAAPSWATWAACTSGGPRSRAACTRSGGRASAAVIVFVGFNLTFFPQFVLGYLGMPRRYHGYPEEFQVLNVMSLRGRLDPGRGLPAPDRSTWPGRCATARSRPRTPGPPRASSGRRPRRRPPRTSR